MNCVPMELLEELAGRLPEIPTRDSGTATAQAFHIEQWIKERGLDVSGPSEWKGARRWIFRTCPWNSNHDNRSAYILQFPNGAIAAGCLHTGCRGRDWHALRNLVDPGWASRSGRERVTAPAPLNVDWELPVPFHQFELPPFPIQALPGWLRDFVGTVATATQTPADLAGLLALAVLAASCAKKVVVRVKPGYVEPVNIFVMVSLAPGNRKSAVFRWMVAPLENYEQREIARVGPEIARSKAALKIKEATLRKLQEKAVSAKGSERARFTDEAVAVAAEISESPVPAEPRYIADDCTPERLATLLRDHDGRMAVMSPEGDVFDVMAGRYSANAGSNFAVYLKGHAGDALRVDRVGRPPEYVKDPALTIGLAVQPDVIRGLTSNPGFRERGLLGRFFYALPASLLGHRETDPPPVPDEYRATYHAQVHALLEFPFKRVGGEQCPHELSFSAGARTRIQEFEKWIEPQLSEFGDLGGITDWAGKLVGAIVRIAGLLHMCNLAETPAPWDHAISEETAKSAIQIGWYLIPHAKAAFAEMGADQFVGQAKMILRWIEQSNPTTFTKRDLHQALRSTFKRVEELERPLAILLSHRFIRKAEDAPSGGPGRRPSPIYEVNPIWASLLDRDSPTEPSGHDSEDCEDSERPTSLGRAAARSARDRSTQATENVELE